MRFDSPLSFGPAHFSAELDFETIDTMTQLPPTGGQTTFIANLRTAWQDAEDELARLTGREARRPKWADPASREEASAMIGKGQGARDAIRAELSEARRAARLTDGVAKQEIGPGLYVIGDNISTAYVYKVQKNRETGALYAKVLDESGWEYVGRKPFHSITRNGHPMTADEAAWLGKDGSSPIAGSCVSCSLGLTDETSLHYGYGEICAGNNGWPYAKGAERA